MNRPQILGIGMLLSLGILYSCFLVLDLYWNIIDWRFRLDEVSVIALLTICGALFFLWSFRAYPYHRVIVWVGYLLALGMIAAAVNSIFPEPLASGLLTRTHPSPTWYRIGRFLLMCLPLIFLALGQFGRRVGSTK